jgi:hypothetical protein
VQIDCIGSHILCSTQTITMKKQSHQVVSQYKVTTEKNCSKAILTLEDTTSGEFCSTEWILTQHCLMRLSQRGFSYRHVLMAMEFGEEQFKQGMIFYVMTNKSLPPSLSVFDRAKLINMVVVVSMDASVLTCYKAPNGMKHVKRKSKILCKTNSRFQTSRLN